MKKCIRVLTAVLAITLSASGLSYAAGKGDGKLNPWTECGIGAMIFDDTPWAAAISNVIWDWGITASTTTSSSPDMCAGDEIKVAAFINETYLNVAEETAIGAGDHIVAALNILGCDSQSHSDITAALRADFTLMVQEPSYSNKSNSEKAEAYYFNLMDKVEGEFAQQCTAS